MATMTHSLGNVLGHNDITIGNVLGDNDVTKMSEICIRVSMTSWRWCDVILTSNSYKLGKVSEKDEGTALPPIF